MSDYFDRIEGHLLDAVERHAKRRPIRWRDRQRLRDGGAIGTRAGEGLLFRTLTIGNIFAVAMATISILVAAAALVLLNNHRRVAANNPGKSPSSRQQLMDSLAVLRRPQTRADLDPTVLSLYPDQTKLPARLQAQLGAPDRSLIRMVSVPSVRAKVAIIP
jgi:hypothetical protein